MPVGWKQFFKITSDDFKTYYDQGKKWGDLDPIKITLSNNVYYTVGLYGMPAEGSEMSRYSPKIAQPQGYPTRITAKLIFFTEAGTPISCEAVIYIVFYKNGDPAKSSTGAFGFGYVFPVKVEPSVNTGEFHEFKVETSGNKITLYLDGYKDGEVTLETPLQSFSFLVVLKRYYVASESTQEPAEPQQQDGFALAIYEITGEYYDQWEDLFNMMTQVMFIMMLIMMGVMLFTMIFRIFKPKKKGGEETGGG
jgi:hypothetical protein